MEINEYQCAAQETSQLRLGGPHSAVAPMLGLASATGAILNVYKKYLRHAESHRALLPAEVVDQ
ncbi:MAG: hypothetical protein WCF33_18310 [Pseudonocardiaceae bacterium]